MDRNKKKIVPGSEAAGGESAPGMDPEMYHLPVMLQEAVDALFIRPEGVYVDCTFGGGGHSAEILKRLGPQGKLVVFDQDEDAKVNVPDDPRILFVGSNFRHLQRFLRLHKLVKVDGVLADLGVSSHQFDEAGRGFSIRFDGDMDMRMDKRQKLTAFDVVNTFTESQLHKLFEQYGEVTNARTLAKAIVQVRSSQSLKTIQNFKSALSAVVKGNPNKYFAQVFQALRIEVNDELGALKELLPQLPGSACSGRQGRSDHIPFAWKTGSLKIFLRKGSFEEEMQDLFGQTTVTPLLGTGN